MNRGFLLALDASTKQGSAAIVTDQGDLVADSAITLQGGNSGELMPLIANMMRDASVSPSQLIGIFCGAGPGSFTGLRIAASIAKGFASGLSIPIYPVSSLLLIPAGVQGGIAAGEYLALLDAMRGEYHALRCTVDDCGIVHRSGEDELLDSSAIQSQAANASESVVAAGPGFTVDALPHARGVHRISHWVSPIDAVDTDSWEPTYGRLAEAEVRLKQRAAAERGG
jgi:tRNA threonylcarbamoyladenosine biosynthesis protein TsaB